MERLAVGSAEARCEADGIMSTGPVHAVTADFATLCGAAAVFVFLEHEFEAVMAGAADSACPSCVSLASVAQLAPAPA